MANNDTNTEKLKSPSSKKGLTALFGSVLAGDVPDIPIADPKPKKETPPDPKPKKEMKPQTPEDNQNKTVDKKKKSAPAAEKPASTRKRKTKLAEPKPEPESKPADTEKISKHVSVVLTPSTYQKLMDAYIEELAVMGKRISLNSFLTEIIEKDLSSRTKK